MSVLDRGTTILHKNDPELSPPPRRMTAEEFLALPDDGIHRELVAGRLWEEGITYRNRFHAAAETNVAFLLKTWCRQQPEPRGLIVSGEAGFRWGEGETETIVGVDVAYVTPEQLAATATDQRVFQGAPALAVEILSGSETTRRSWSGSRRTSRPGQWSGSLIPIFGRSRSTTRAVPRSF